MKKTLIIFSICLFVVQCFAINPVKLDGADNSEQFISIAEFAEIYKDETNELSFNDVIQKDTEFKIIGEPNLNLNFTSSSYWVKFELQNNTDHSLDYLVETARTLTNIADLYVFNEGLLVAKYKNGDEIKFSERIIDHRKILFPISLQPNTTTQFMLHLKSDGEVLTVPIKLWKPQALMKSDYKEQYILGFYYGILVFVIIIYFFFYIALKDVSFLYYVVYVVSLFLFQLSYDGLAFQYLWSNNVWLGNHATVILASTTVFWINMYAKTYLKTNELLPFCEKIFNFFVAISAFSALLGVTSGSLYSIAFPVVNTLALISTLYIFTAILISIKKHCRVNPFFVTAFVSIQIGSIIFILANFSIIPQNMFTDHAIKFGSAFEVIFLSISMAGKYKDAQREKEEAQAETLVKLKEVNKLKEEANMKLELQVKERTKEIEKQKEEIEEKNHDIMGSIHYSQRIQNAILPSQKLIDECLPDSFVLYKPKDIVSGDFYWVASVISSITKEELVVFSAADCTGHGVPGAFMSLIGNSYLKLSLTEKSVNLPADALGFLNAGVYSTLQQNEGETLRDGMDIALCALFKESKKLYFAGAKNPLYIIKNGELTEIKGDKHPIGAYVSDDLQPFTNHEIQLAGGECIYIFSDGFADQFGGSKGKKFMYKKFKELLLEIHLKPMPEQKEILWNTFKEWKGDLDQIDDVCIIGVRV